jgi:glycosyltransferase involved in cell wall biosynthesis
MVESPSVLPYELSVVMPCLNEAETLAICIDKAQAFLRRSGIRGEVVVADNGSQDDSQAIAEAHGARVVTVPEKGYGSALMGGIRAARGRYVIMGDADDSYDFSALEAFIEPLRAGYALVMGNRFRGGILPGAMPPLHRYLGNPVLSGIGRMFFRSPIRDFHCGLRGFDREKILALDLRTTGMEFASEMVVKATLNGLRITEVPTILHRDGRSRPPHLRSWRDGWRHLRFLLLYSPRWLFYYPGLVLTIIGLLGMGILIPGPVTVGHIVFDIHSLLLSGAALVLGIQAVAFAVLARHYATKSGLLPVRPGFSSLLGRLSLEHLLIAGLLCILAGIGGILFSIYLWGKTTFGPVDAGQMMRLLVPATVLTLAGAQIIFSAFFKSLIDLETRSGC